MQAQHVPVLVVGAGPAGLAVAGSLVERGVRPLVIERGHAVGPAWRNHYERLHLHTVKQHSALPHRPFPADAPRYVPRAGVVAYLDDYARHFQIAPRFGEEAVAITRRDGGWHTRCRSGLEFAADAVVLASGASSEPNRPDFPGQEDYRGQLVHSGSYREPSPFAGRRVLVVGMGNTGAEIALDLAQQGVQVTIAVRSPINMVRRDVLGRPTQLTALMLWRLPTRVGDALARKLRDWTVGDLSRWGIRTSAISPLQQQREEGRAPVIDIGTLALIQDGRIGIRPGIEGFTQDGVRFVDGRVESFDTVMLATGYRPAVQKLFPESALPLDGRGLPAGVIGSGPLAGVYFVGFDFRQPGLLRTIEKQGRLVAEAIAPLVTKAA